MANGKLWTEGEIISLRQMAAEYKTIDEAAAVLDRSRNAVRKRAQSLKIRFKKRQDWSKEEETLLIELYKRGVSSEVMADQLGRNKEALITKAYRLGISDRAGKKLFKFTDDEIDEMIEMYKDNVRVREIAEVFGISPSLVTLTMKENGVTLKKELGISAKRRGEQLIPFKRLTRLYLNECLTQAQIADIEGVSRNIVRGSLIHHGIVRKSVQKRIKERKAFLRKRGRKI